LKLSYNVSNRYLLSENFKAIA